MNAPEIQRLKMAWLAAREANDAQAQMQLLQDHPDEQEALIDFIAAYHATGGEEVVQIDTPLLALTQRASERAFERVFAAELSVATLGELRKARRLSKADVAKGLRLGLDVWNKFEAGAIEFVSLSQAQTKRLAQFFQVSTEQFQHLLGSSQPGVTVHFRQTREAARSGQQGPSKQSFQEAIARSSMSESDKHFWSE
jgi:transcriptional regulator with XRE-family HTH domain